MVVYTTLGRDDSIRALAYTADNLTLPTPCFLLVRFSDTEATISLKISIPVHGFDDKHVFTFVYNADNLVPGKNTLDTTGIPRLSHTQVNDIARNNAHANTTTLSLTLKSHCPIWCTFSGEAIVLKDGSDFLRLARAKEVRILFDANWIHSSKHAHFQSLINHPEKLAGLPVRDKDRKQYRQVDWTAFKVSEHEGPPSYDIASNKGRHDKPATTRSTPERLSFDHAALSSAPFPEPSPTEEATPSPKSPPSTDLAHESHYDFAPENPPPYTKKRPLHAGTTSTPEKSSAKRKLISPTFPATTPSPTEKATSNPELLSSPDFQEATTRGLQKLLSEVVKTEVERLLPGIVKTALSELLAAPVLSPSTSSSSPNAAPNATPSLHTLIRTLVDEYAENHVQKICADTVELAEDLRNTADAEFVEAIEDQKADLALYRDDMIAEVHSAAQHELAEFSESAAQMSEGLMEDTEEMLENLHERMRDLHEEPIKPKRLIAKSTSERSYRGGPRSISLPL